MGTPLGPGAEARPFIAFTVASRLSTVMPESFVSWFALG